MKRKPIGIVHPMGSSNQEPRTWPWQWVQKLKQRTDFSPWRNLFEGTLEHFYGLGCRWVQLHLPFGTTRIDGKGVWPMQFDAAVEVAEEIRRGIWDASCHPQHFRTHFANFMQRHRDIRVDCYLGSIKYDASVRDLELEEWTRRCLESIRYITEAGKNDAQIRSRIGMMFDHVGGHFLESDSGYHFARMIHTFGHPITFEAHPNDASTAPGADREFLLRHDFFSTADFWRRAWTNYETRSRIRGMRILGEYRSHSAEEHASVLDLETCDAYMIPAKDWVPMLQANAERIDTTIDKLVHAPVMR